jgi:hypothetical protein
MYLKLTLFLLTILGISLFLLREDAFSYVVKEKGKTYIVDRNGYRWDVTQAESIGFRPEGFQYGIGKNAFTPLDDNSMSEDISRVAPSLRIIGISEGSEAKAYSVPTLRGHEIANSEIGSKPIATAY